MKDGEIIGIYKPRGPTSHDIVDRVRKITGIKKVGHAGTLDPLASGVLVMAIGRSATKKISEYVGKEKEYIADVRFGVESETDDEEGKKHRIKQPDNHKVKLEEVEKVIPKFIGIIEQVPPIYSALKIKGKSAYKYARKGEVVKMKSREIEIKEIEILDYKWPDLKLRVVTGPGVYIRALARDIGHDLRVGGYLAGLERTRVGEFVIKDSLRLDS